jgi:RNA polymerase sigma-70 factor (ECF subfamily)
MSIFAARSVATPDRELRTTELAAALQSALARLPERRRLVFTLSREQGLTYNEIAKLLGISPKTVEMQMGRAYRTLRKYLAPYWP